jgi:CelD/BcsL family acetyltransferase involved in cellulose biosynthesis
MATIALEKANESAADISQINKPVEVRVRVIMSRSEIEEIRSVWISMQRHPNADIDCYITLLESGSGKAWKPHILIVYRGGIPEAMLIGRVESTRLSLKIGYAELLKPRVRALVFIYGGLLGNASAENCELLAREAVKSLRNYVADIAFFNHLRADSNLYPALRSVPGFIIRDHFPSVQNHRIMQLPGTESEFWHTLSLKLRKNLRWKKLLKEHADDVKIHCFRKVSELDRMVKDVEQVAKTTYQRALRVGFSDDLEMRALFCLKARNGWLRAFVLYANDRPCAFWIGTIYQGTLHSDQMGYDPEYRAYSPGMYLVMRSIEGFRISDTEKEIRAVDFGMGDAEYKATLGNEEWEDASIYLFAPHARGLMLNSIRTPILLIDKVAKMILRKAQLLQQVKRVWRHRAQKTTGDK